MKTIKVIFIVFGVALISCREVGQKRSNEQTFSVQDSVLLSNPLSNLADESVVGADSSVSLYDSIPATFKVRSSDWLYYRGKRYILAETPLRKIFDNYETFFFFLPKIHSQYGWGLGYDDKPYQIVWLLEGDRLYVADINIDVARDENGEPRDVYGHTWEEIYAMMERNTGSCFDRIIPVRDSTELSLRFGLMPADWFSGTIFAKRYFYDTHGQNTMKQYEEWKQEPFQQLIFKDGYLKRVVNRFNSSDEATHSSRSGKNEPVN